MHSRPDVIFAATPDVAIPSLDIINEVANIVVVLTKKDSSKGRGKKIVQSEIKKRALELGLDVLEEPNSQELIDYLKSRNISKIDLGIVVAYGKIFKTDMLNIPINGWLNLHFSLLPQYRGASPAQYSILKGDRIGGVSIFRLNEGIDDGDIVLQKSIEISQNITSGEYLQLLSTIGSQALKEASLQVISHQATYIAQSQISTESEIIYAEKITKDTSKIDWSDLPVNIVNMINAYSPNPGAWFEFKNDKDGSILRVVALKAKLSQNGEVELVELKPAGKNSMSYKAFINGYKGIILQ